MPANAPFPDELKGDNKTLVLLREVWNRLNAQNEHWMHVILGEEGSGKSHTAIRIAEMIDPDFDINQIIFDPASLLQRLRNDKYSAGDVFLIDEAGVSMGKRTWHDSGQVKLNQALQLIRNHNVGCIFTLPRLGELDSQTQGRLQSYLELSKKVPGRYVAGRWRSMDPDRTDRTGEIYRRTPEVHETRIPQVAFTPPKNQELVNQYEDEKADFQARFYDEAIDALGDGDTTDDEKTTSEQVAEQILSNGGPQEYLREINNGAQTVLDRSQIEADFDIGRRRSKRVKKALINDIGRDDII